jgi:hypothetical protein
VRREASRLGAPRVVAQRVAAIRAVGTGRPADGRARRTLYSAARSTWGERPLGGACFRRVLSHADSGVGRHPHRALARRRARFAELAQTDSVLPLRRALSARARPTRRAAPSSSRALTTAARRGGARRLPGVRAGGPGDATPFPRCSSRLLLAAGAAGRRR